MRAELASRISELAFGGNDGAAAGDDNALGAEFASISLDGADEVHFGFHSRVAYTRGQRCMRGAARAAVRVAPGLG